MMTLTLAEILVGFAWVLLAVLVIVALACLLAGAWQAHTARWRTS